MSDKYSLLIECHFPKGKTKFSFLAGEQIFSANRINPPTGASTNPKNFDLNKNLNINLI